MRKLSRKIPGEVTKVAACSYAEHAAARLQVGQWKEIGARADGAIGRDSKTPRRTVAYARFRRQGVVHGQVAESEERVICRSSDCGRTLEKFSEKRAGSGPSRGQRRLRA